MSKLTSTASRPQADRPARSNHPVSCAPRTSRSRRASPALCCSEPPKTSKRRQALHLSLEGIGVFDHRQSRSSRSSPATVRHRKAKGGPCGDPVQLQNPYHFGAMLVRQGIVDGQYTASPLLPIHPTRAPSDPPAAWTLGCGRALPDGCSRTAPCSLPIHVNVDPARRIAEIAISVREMGILGKPRVAISRFPISATARHPCRPRSPGRGRARTRKRPGHRRRDACRHRLPEMLSNMYLQPARGSANILIFPNLDSGTSPTAHDRAVGQGRRAASDGLEQGLQRPAAQHRHGEVVTSSS